jgi:DNA-binding beta-propeller fold protein YncE
MLLYGATLLAVIPPLVTAGMASATATPWITLPIVSAAEAWLVLLPFLALASGAAADQLIAAFDRAWAILVPLPRVVAAAALLLMALAGRETFLLMGQLGRATATAQSETEVAMAQYLASCLRGEASDDPCNRQGEDSPIFYVPPAAVNHPATRLLLGAALDTGRVRAFDPSRDLLPSSTVTDDRFYLVALENQPVIELLRQLYPTAQLRAQPTDQAGPTLFLVVQVPLADLLAHQGLAGGYFAGAESTESALETRMDGPLFFDWGDNPPLEGPFHVLWEGSLLVPAAGTYLFAIDSSESGPEAPIISLQLDGNLVLDSSLGLVEKGEMLAQGAYHFTLRYRSSGASGDWALRWTPPGGAPQPLPRTQLYSPALPNIGLLGIYYAGSSWDGATLAVRKDLVLGAPVDLPPPFSVHWNGRIAATRAGEYFFAVTANGPVTLMIDGRETLFHMPSADLSDGLGFSQASIYLEQGWHDVDLRYAPEGTPDLRVLWQPPGSGPLLLASRYLLPTQAQVTMNDVPLPPAPELVDTRLGNDRFALSANLEPYRPIRTLPPDNVSLLVSEPGWALANGCGADDSQFASPRGIAIDAQNGRVYVADSENRRVVELMLDDGSYVTSYRLPEFQEPVDVAIDLGGALLVLDATVQNIFRIDRATGESAVMALGTGFYHPRGFALDKAGNIVVADTGGARVVVLDAAGNFLTQYGGLETALGQGQPADVVASGDQLWAIAADHGRLWRLDVLGSLAVSERASTVTGPQLAALPDGSGFFMSDPVRRTVLYFAPSGQPAGQLGYADHFANPVGIAAAAGESGFVHLVVGDSAACTVSMWRLRRQTGP